MVYLRCQDVARIVHTELNIMGNFIKYYTAVQTIISEAGYQ